MSQAEYRTLALRFVFVTIAWISCLFTWVAVLTFDAADAPSGSVWPQNAQPANLCGPFGAYLSFALFYYLGLGTYALLALLTAGLAAFSNRIPLPQLELRLVGAALVVATISAGAALLFSDSERYLISGPGGVVGSMAVWYLLPKLNLSGMVLLLVMCFLVGMLVAADELVVRFFRWSADATVRTAPRIAVGGRAALAGAGAAANHVGGGLIAVAGRLATAGVGAASPAASPPPVERGHGRRKRVVDDFDGETELDAIEASAPAELEEDEATYEADVDDDEDTDPEEAGARAMLPAPAALKITDVTRRREPPAPATYRKRVGNYELPNEAILEDADPIDKESIEILCREKAYVLEQTLNEFRLEVKVASIETGPVITVFELKLAPGIKVSQIASLTNDMARALKAPAVRVVAPLPGRNTIGIEVPNLDKEKVRIKDLMRRAAKRTETYHIPLYLGKDASGQPLISDLTRMPHMLIAGTTGSGKSVCVSSVIVSILMTRTPDEVQLILIDPKVVELSIFKDIPHLMCPIVTEMSKAEGILDWAATKMDERYALLAEAGVKDIVSYNRLGEAGLRERMGIESDDELARVPIHMPYIVIVVDELADLMMTSAKEVEFYLCRLAQKSRAVGIHLIVSTQRPQANVVTGLIKSNLPSRIAFRVSSRLDSRIVLDQNGGEVLMGQGDMLFLPPGQSKLVRAQGTFVGDDELRGVVRHVKSQGEPNFDPQLMRAPKSGEGGGERDELFDEAVDAIIASGRGSVSLLQRKLTIGYGRASRLIDQMYDSGIVGEYKGSQAREVLLTQDEWNRIRDARDRADMGDLFA